jgi:hypothetical protein
VLDFCPVAHPAVRSTAARTSGSHDFDERRID